ncbi:MAG: replicative DNA helicase [Firmicutes bacterium]|nr:replicative DNA helicase [Bacillota bacterium]
MPERIPPHSKEAEQAVLGAALLNKDALSDAIEIIKPEDFYDTAHKEIYSAMLDLFQSSVKVDIITVSEELKKRGSLELAGGRAYIAWLPDNTPSSYNAAGYARIVARSADLRALITAADEIRDRSYSESDDSTAILDRAEQKIFEIAQKRQGRDYTHIKDVMRDSLDIINKAALSEGTLTGVSTGFSQLDKMTRGLQKSNLIIVAARPAMGKSAFALNIALNAAKKSNASVLIFNLEMSKGEIGNRLLAMEANVEMERILEGKTLTQEDWGAIGEATNRMGKMNIAIDDTPNISILEMKNKCRRMKAEHGLDLVVLDYLQLMDSGTKVENRQQEISKFSRSLKLLAKEMECPVIVLSQLNRAPDLRSDDHRPRMADLRESGSIEQDADIVMFLYRDDYYNKEESPIPGICEVHIAKHRNGQTGKIDLAWVERYTRFNEIAY